VSVADLPVAPPVSPMLAKLAREVPLGDYLYEPKWDGFRCIVFREGNDVEMGSRNGLSLTRYFPELVAALQHALPPRVVIDGEVVVVGEAGLDFDALSQRVHPAESRVRLLAERTPASFVAFDVLALGERDLRGEPFEERRHRLEELLPAPDAVTVHLTPATRDAEVAKDWFRRFEGAGLDGVVAKPSHLAYLPDKRAMVKVKHERTAEFVVGGFRWYRAGGALGRDIGSLLLGLYNSGGRLCHVGVIGSFPAVQRRDLVELLVPYMAAGTAHPWAEWASPGTEAGAGSAEAGHAAAPTAAARLPGARSRWNAAKDLSFEPLRPELVVEAAYEHLQGDRLRHMAQFRRWRPDRDPRSCTYEQLEAVVPVELAEVFGARLVMRAGQRRGHK
jgi:ATP-dependent DNA ligase